MKDGRTGKQQNVAGGATPARGRLFQSQALQRVEARAPSLFRLDNDYDPTQLARPMNLFVRDSVHAFEAIGTAIDDAADRIEAARSAAEDRAGGIDGRMDDLEARITALETDVAALQADVASLETDLAAYRGYPTFQDFGATGLPSVTLPAGGTWAWTNCSIVRHSAFTATIAILGTLTVGAAVTTILTCDFTLPASLVASFRQYGAVGGVSINTRRGEIQVINNLFRVSVRVAPGEAAQTVYSVSGTVTFHND